MVDRSMKGLFPILAMPFDARGRIDVEDLQREVDFAIGAGAEGLGIALASEIMKLSEGERDLATKTVVDQVGSRVPVVVNSGAPGTDLAVQYSRRAEELGANAVMVTPPVAALPSGELVREYYRHVSDSVDVPIFIQDTDTAPVPPVLAAQIARESENACYLKAETPPTPVRVGQAVEAGAGSLIVFGGAGGGFLLEEMQRGAVGTMPHCALPDVFGRIIDLFNAGKSDDAEQEFNRYASFFRLLGGGSGPSPFHVVKEVLRLRGVFKAAYARHPAVPPDESTYREVRRIAEGLALDEGTPPL